MTRMHIAIAIHQQCNCTQWKLDIMMSPHTQTLHWPPNLQDKQCEQMSTLLATHLHQIRAQYLGCYGILSISPCKCPNSHSPGLPASELFNTISVACKSRKYSCLCVMHTAVAQPWGWCGMQNSRFLCILYVPCPITSNITPSDQPRSCCPTFQCRKNLPSDQELVFETTLGTSLYNMCAECM